jgi:glycerol-3-phosphate O-acyltransferase
MSDFLEKLDRCYQEKKINDKYYKILKDFYFSFENAVKNSSIKKEEYSKSFDILLDLILSQYISPYKFENYHKKITTPFNYYEFGKKFVSYLIDKQNSKIYGKENLHLINKYLQNNENVILLSNHQTEADPQIIDILLEDEFKNISNKIIYVAGSRVVADPFAIPFSIGCNLLSIYSKKYLDLNPEAKHQKQLHNRKTMQVMKDLLSKGSEIIYVAPSGGRDRKNKNKIIEISPFDPSSIEMFYFMAKKAITKTHFFALTLYTYDIMPPPENVQIEMGEKRVVNRKNAILSFSNEIDMENIIDTNNLNKKEIRKKRSDFIYNIVKKEFNKITEG